MVIRTHCIQTLKFIFFRWNENFSITQEYVENVSNLKFFLAQFSVNKKYKTHFMCKRKRIQWYLLRSIYYYTSL